ncbi:hypothetical protein CBOM_08059 [Ceraceosorus bombacis]|uniref:Uncharacterized protein n=1 Tax=Ceraceosorus bombacis TaxID=401625 RepID=A0A0P1BS40_9BASI|nr:hypothetical protein CBOM_08059 [Ceraceosorus bombacis]
MPHSYASPTVTAPLRLDRFTSRHRCGAARASLNPIPAIRCTAAADGPPASDVRGSIIGAWRDFKRTVNRQSLRLCQFLTIGRS